MNQNEKKIWKEVIYLRTTESFVTIVPEPKDIEINDSIVSSGFYLGKTLVLLSFIFIT